ncbi:hypothetical protein Cni_G09464 [Canna indica]|uniref:Uncharacterized protein n=1 Tax=Canna indica TaxID=4628 RepID=A0AAQ3Q8X0_9LILI|nr:hypothetical protein Cni_G09464 [Canna indica]
MVVKDHGNETEKVECECCGMSEECTPTYINGVKEFFFGRWVCGICSEAVKEDVKQRPAVPMEEALQTHMALCKSFKSNRVNPQLSLASAMRDIARKSLEHRRTSDDDFFAASNMVSRTASCGSRRVAPAGVKIRRSSFQ